jgi:hypothetical protein
MTTSNKMLESMVQEYLDLLKQFSSTTKGVSGNLARLTKEISPMVVALSQANNAYKVQQLRGKQQASALQREFDLKTKLNKQTEDLVSLRARETKQIEEIHGEQVRRNIELRHTLEKTVNAFSQFQNAFGGIGFKKVMGMGFKAWTDPVRASHQFKKEEAKLFDAEFEMAKIGKSSFGGGKKLSTLMEEAEKAGYTSDKWIKRQGFDQKTQTDYIKARQDFSAQEREKFSTEQTMEKSPLYTFLREHKGLSSLLAMKGYTERVAKWADENKGGIALSIISMGIFIGLLKKMFDASPMLGKMFSLFKVMFDLVLRPFGDMIGFFLLPILKVVMNAVLPWFSRVYPILIKWGLDFGNALAKWDFGTMFQSLIEYLSMIVGLLGTPEEQEAARSAGTWGLAATAGTIVGGKWAAGKVAGRFGGNAGWKGGGSASGVGNLNKIAQKIGWKNVAMFSAKGAFRAIPIAGWAFLASEIGLGALKALNPEAYEQLRNDAEWMGLAREFILPENTILEGFGAWELNGNNTGNVVEGDTYNIYGVDQQTANAVFQERSTMEERNMNRKLSEARSTRFS